MKAPRNDNGVPGLGKYLGEPLPVIYMHIRSVLDQQLLQQHRVATNIHASAETLLTVGEICEQFMRVTSPMLTAFSTLV
jgi:hypothetical protein